MAKQNNDSGKFSQSDEKRASKMAKLMADMQKSGYDFSADIEKADDGFNSISNAILGINKSDFFVKMNSSAEDISRMTKEVKILTEAFNETAESLNKNFAKSILGNTTNLKNLVKEFSKSTPEMGKALSDALKTKDFSAFIDKWGDEGLSAFKKITNKLQDKRGLSDFIKNGPKEFKNINEELKKATAELEEANKEVFSLSNALTKIGKNFAKNISPQKIVDTLMAFDDKLSDIQRKFNVTGEQIRATSEAMSSLVSNGAQFGVSTEESFKNVEQLANTLKTNNIPAVAELAKQFQAIPGALGATGEEVNGIVGQMKFLGDSTEDIKNMFTNIAKTSKIYGVNVSKVTSEIAKELPKWQKMGFKEGEASLVRFAAKAEKLGVSMDSILKVTEAFQMNLENSIDSAAQLQLVGGSFANVDPFSLMSASEQGGEAMTDMISKLGADIGKFNENGEFKISPVDRKRLSMAGDALHLSLDEMTTMVSQAAIKNKKIDLLGSTLQGLSPEDQEFITNLSSIGDKGEIKLDVGGVTDLSKLTPEMIKSARTKVENDAKDLDARNVANQSLKQSFDNFVNSLLSAMTVFEPVLKVLGSILNSITWVFTKISTTFDKLIDGSGKWIAAIVALTAALLFSFGGSGFKKLLGGIKSAGGGGLFNKIKGGTESSGEAGVGAGFGDKIGKVGGQIKSGIGGIMQTLSGVFGEVTKFLTSVLTDVVNLVTDVATSIVDGVAGMMPSLQKIATGISKIISTIVSAISKNFITLMSALGKGITAFFVPMAALAAPPVILGIAVFTLAMIGLGYAFKLVGEGLGAMAPAITAILNGVGTVVKDIGTSIATVITSIADSILKLSNIPGESLFVLAGGILALSGAMIAFGAGSIIGGIGAIFGGGMFASLEHIAMMAPMISMAAVSINSMAEGVQKLNIAIKELDTTKLESLSSSAERLSTASAISGLANAVFGGNTGKSENTQTIKLEPITINLKLSGRDIQQIIIDDTKLVS